MSKSNTIKVMDIKSFVNEKGFTQIVPKVRTNVNDYPYLTFITGDNKAENVYFSKSESSVVAEGQELDKDYLKSLKVAEATNADGEIRFKLTTGDSNRIELDFL